MLRHRKATQMSDWEPDLYNRFRRYRAEPVAHILSRLQLGDSEKIIDLGCGSGKNTFELGQRSAHGSALGVDVSPAMIEAARKLLEAEPAELKRRVSFELLNLAEFRADRAYTLIFSNAAFQWIPDHRALFAACFDALRRGGTIVVQMPANETETAKMEIGQLARETPWNTMLGGRERAFHEEPPEFYAAMLAKLGYDRIDCYYLTFHRPMERPADVVQWYRSTGLRPFFARPHKNRHAEFLERLTTRLDAAYGT